MARRFCHIDFPIFTALIVMESSNVVTKTLFKAATSKGMNTYVFVVYCKAIAALVLLPALFISYRSRVLPPLSFSILLKIGLLGLMGSVIQNMGYSGVRYSSPTLSSAMSNLAPAFTFILAIIFRMEKVCFRRTSSMAKVLGTMVSITGAFLITLFKGPPIISTKHSVSLHQPLTQPSISNWTIGGALCAVEYTLVPLSSILMAQIMKEFPAEFTMMFFYFITVSSSSAIFTLIAEKNNPSAWRITPDIALVCIIYGGLLGSCAYWTVQAWAVHRKGPVYVAMFKPLSIIIAIIMGVLFLGDSLYLGSLIGATLISVGFYTVMWGKAEEEKGDKCVIDALDSADAERVPLLKSYEDEPPRKTNT